MENKRIIQKSDQILNVDKEKNTFKTKTNIQEVNVKNTGIYTWKSSPQEQSNEVKTLKSSLLEEHSEKEKENFRYSNPFKIFQLT